MLLISNTDDERKRPMNLIHTLGLLLLGAAAGYLYSELRKDQAKTMMVMVPAGNEFSVRLDQTHVDSPDAP